MNTALNYSNMLCYRCKEKKLILDYQSGDIICCNCGEIISDRIIDEGNDVHVYDNDSSTKKSSRSSGFAESIGCYQTSFVTSNSNNMNLVQSLERAQKLSSDPKELKVLMHMGLVNEMCSKMNLTVSIKDKAVEIFTRVVIERATVFRNKEIIVAACIYIAARMENYPRTLDEIGAAFNITTKEISRIQKLIISKLNIILCRLHPEHLLNRFSSRMQCNYQVNVISKEICSNLLKYELLESIPPQIVTSGVILLSMALLDASSIDVTRLLSIAIINLSSLKLIVKQLLKLLKVILPERYQTVKSDCIEDKLNNALSGNNNNYQANNSSNNNNKSSSNNNSGGVCSVGDQKKRDQGAVAATSSSSAVVIVNNTVKNDRKKRNNTVDNNNKDSSSCKRQQHLKNNKLQTTSSSDIVPHTAVAGAGNIRTSNLLLHSSSSISSSSSSTTYRNNAVVNNNINNDHVVLKHQQQHLQHHPRDINLTAKTMAVSSSSSCSCSCSSSSSSSSSSSYQGCSPTSKVQLKEREDDDMTITNTTLSSASSSSSSSAALSTVGLKRTIENCC